MDVVRVAEAGAYSTQKNPLVGRRPAPNGDSDAQYRAAGIYRMSISGAYIYP